MSRWTSSSAWTASAFTSSRRGAGPFERKALIALFRACQEAMNNVARHAQAESVLVQVSAEDGRVRIEIEDDGKGFDSGAPAPTDRAHWGLLGIQERASILGGRARIDSAPGRGTRVEIEVPLPAAA